LYIFEDGLQLSEIPMQVRETSNNPKLSGVGVYQGDGIYFGNVMEKIETSIQDYKKAPLSDGIASNTGYNALVDITGGLAPTGPIFAETIIKPITISDMESSDSQEYRNANNSNPQT
jgi:hypothetical protein